MIANDTKLDYKGVFGMDGFKTIWEAISNHWFIKGIASFIVAFIDSLLSCSYLPSQETLTVIFILIIFDTVTGFAKAFKNHDVSSSGFFRFALKILVYFILLATGSILDHVVQISGVSALTIVSAFLAITESLSILENIAGLGYAVPAKLVSLLKLTKRSYNSLDKDDDVRKTLSE